LIYDEQRYQYRKKFSRDKFERECLTEYAGTFSTVCVDAGYYKFPTEKYVGELCAQVPEEFKFGFKVTDDITLKKFPSLPRFALGLWPNSGPTTIGRRVARSSCRAEGEVFSLPADSLLSWRLRTNSQRLHL
jgi:uncharacterized protein YecE (DUF72 family)